MELPQFKRKIYSFGNKIIVMPIFPPSKTESGIVIPPNPRGEKANEGIVLNNYNKDFITLLFEGVHVMFSQYAGIEITVQDDHNNDVILKALNPEDILLTISNLPPSL